jgi:hypothetical protein
MEALPRRLAAAGARTVGPPPRPTPLETGPGQAKAYRVARAQEQSACGLLSARQLNFIFG